MSDHLDSYLRKLAQQREGCMASARMARQHYRNGLTSANAVTYWVLMARSYNDSICRVLHMAPGRFDTHYAI